MRYAQIKKEISPNPFKDTNIYQLKNYRCILSIKFTHRQSKFNINCSIFSEYFLNSQKQITTFHADILQAHTIDHGTVILRNIILFLYYSLFFLTTGNGSPTDYPLSGRRYRIP